MTADVSVVLPCAYEYEYAARTVRSVSAATPPEILREIVVVDDGSTPPLRIPEPARWKAFVVRLEKTGGLIRARIAGAAAATGAVIIFFDCHVRPMDGYWRGLLAPIEADYRVATVPTVTRLDAATWQPVGSPRAVRAVGTAVGRNPVSWLIPCHRALRKSGGLGGYHWGLPVKRAMLAFESARAEAQTPPSGRVSAE